MSNYFHAIYGNASPLSPVLLWTNPTPTEPIVTKNVDLDLSGYTGVIVEFFSNTSSEVVFCREYLKFSDGSGYPTYARGCGLSVPDGTRYTRNIVYNYQDNVGIYFGEANNYSSAHEGGVESDPNTVIPIRIYGV